MPKSLLVVGSGAIGIEFASFYRTLGAEVTVVEMLDRVMPVEDEEISALAAKAFTKQGMKLKLGTTVTELKKGADSVTCVLKDKAGKTEDVTIMLNKDTKKTGNLKAGDRVSVQWHEENNQKMAASIREMPAKSASKPAKSSAKPAKS